MTKRGMPSAAQMRVLEAIVAGEWLQHACRGNVWDAFPTNRLMTVQDSTVMAMIHAGWVEYRGDGKISRLTNLGRHALEAARASKGAE